MIQRRLFQRLFCVFTLLGIGLTESSADDLQLMPSAFTLDHSHAIQKLAAVNASENSIGAMVANVKFESDNPEIAKIVNDQVHPVANGETTIRANSPDGRQSTAMVKVTGVDKPHRWSFRNDVQSVLAKQGCNMGACHGALAGKGGFRLSLRGYDSEADFLSITRQARGRRIEIADPGRSLFIAKPTGMLPHKGGLRLDADSRDYEILSRWIGDGAAPPNNQDPVLESISVLPEQANLKAGDQSQILVNAHYNDGSVVDVTHWAKFSATDESVAGVSEDGVVTVLGSGEAAVLVWFGSKVKLARMTVPYANSVNPEVFSDSPRRNFIDEINLNQLQTLNLRPSLRCDDETFLRRSTVDTIGRLPTEHERKEFFEKEEKHRRDWWIDHLLSDADFVDYWTYKWSDVLLINGNRLRPIAVKSYYDWLHDAISRNLPWDQITREVLTSTGSSETRGATNFFALNQSPEDMTENACQAFMGLSIGCAKCHNHPLEKWTNDQYYAMANLFSRVRAKGWGGDSRNGDGKRQVFVSTEGELIQPSKLKPQQPAPLDAPAMEFEDPRDRREVLVDWMTDPNNPYFSRAITNRVWANYFGRGLVEQVDDLRLSNPASNEAMLDATSRHLAEAKFDLKVLMRTILQSETYQRSSLPVDENRDELKYNSRYYPRRMMAEVLLDSIDQVLGTSTNFTQIAFSGADKQKTDFYKAGTRAIELYDSAVDSYFLKTFGRNPRDITCECERDDEPSMVQVLHLSNGETLNPKLESETSLCSQATGEAWDNHKLITELFDRALCRKPTEDEMQSLLKIMAEYEDDRQTAIRDVTWSVLTSTEFTFNH
jgi:Protein of unknown function (DUF1553)/Protein of unknown function (DUF1549)